MRFVLSIHAKKRIRQRGISYFHVQHILSFPDIVIKEENIKIAIGSVEGRAIRIVYKETENYIKVITVI